MRRLLSYLSTHRSFTATGLGVVLLAAVAATIGLTSPGYQAQKLNLDDGTVWVTNQSLSAVGRANPGVLELNSAVRSSSSDISVVQDPQHVLLVNRSDATVGVVDTASAELGQTVPLPPDSPDVLLAGDTVVVLSQKTGQFWTTPVDTLASFDAQTQAELSLGSTVTTGMSPAGRLSAYSADTGELSIVSSVTRFGVTDRARLSLPKRDAFQVATVGSHWAVLDRTTKTLVVDGRAVELSGEITGRATLQRSADAGSSILVAGSSGLVSVSFGGTVTNRVADRSGTPARPVVVGGCSYAAWTDGASWTDCPGAGAAATGVTELASVPSSAALAFAVTGSRVVLNDTAGGRAWAIQRDGQLIDNWGDLIDDQRDQQNDETPVTDDKEKLEVQQNPPVATADNLGARAGRATLLPVLLNDYDPNGDPISIDSVTDPTSAGATVQVVSNRQQIMLTLPAGATGSVTFDYTISDGRGGTSTARVKVGIHGDALNGAPKQVRALRDVVSSSGRVTVDTLGSFVDPDGDPFYLTGASGGDGGTVTFKPTGEVVYQDAGDGPSTQEIVLSLSDGRSTGRGTLQITVDAPGATPLRAESFSVQADENRTTTINPLRYASGGSGAIKLNSVPAKSGVTITPSYSTGTFTFVSGNVGSHQLEYTVTDGQKTATGTIRVDVRSPPDPNTAPITTPKTVFVQTLSSQSVDITATDIDPAGNVLMVTAVDAPATASGVQVQTLEQRYLRITLAQPIEAPVSFTYTVSNGLASSTGTVTVVEIPKPSQLQPPIATNDQVTARAGQAVDIDVLANDEQPDGEDIVLEPKLVSNVSSGGGLLFVAGEQLRYLAPTTPGNFTAEYAVDGPDGQRATAQVSISVRESDRSTNQAPVPQTVTARVVAGQTVRVQVPLDNIDPDGDSVQLLGVDSNPQKGSVSSVGAGDIEYQAGSYSAGTDTFTYTVVDGLGARATGTVRIGIAPRAQGSKDPIAVADAVTMRPGGSILVRVLANDSDPDGQALRVTAVRPNDASVKATILADGVVRVTPPAKTNTYGLVYTVANASGGSSSNFITVKVDPRAELNYPEAADSVLTLKDVLGRTTVDVDVLANVFFADGSVSSLGLRLVDGYGDTARVLSNKRIRVTVTARSQIIPFAVSHPDDSRITTYAFIRVPGSDETLPQIDETAPGLSVVSGATLDIDLNDHVVATGSNGVRVTDSSTVRATHSDGAKLVVGPSRLRFTSAAGFFGQASISFQVTDGTSADDPNGHVATLVLPITVTARQNQPPVFQASSIDLEPGESRTLDLRRLTTYNYPNDLGQLRYALTTSSVPGFRVELTGSNLTVSATSSAVTGDTGRIGVTVRDRRSAAQAGSVSMTVVRSTRPLAIAAADTAIVKRGSTTVVDVLANDRAANPFPGQALRVIAIRGLGGSSLPKGVSVKPSADKSRLTVTVSASARPTNSNLQYQIADVTGDPSRYVWGNVTISVQDVPDAPAAPTRSGTFVGGELTLAYQASVANNSRITSYRLTGTSGSATYVKDCGTSTLCTLTDLEPGVRYQFSVQAINAVGASQPSALSSAYSADFVPTAPTGVTVTPSSTTPGALVIAWNAVPKPARGTSVASYVVEIAGDGAPGSQTVPASSTSTTIGGLTPGAQYSVQVYAKNAAEVDSSDDWARSGAVTGSPVGTPAPVTGITASSDRNGAITVSWTAAGSNGGSAVNYVVGRDAAGSSTPACSATSKPGAISGSLQATSYVDSNASDGKSYTYFVYADNGYFCSAAKSDGVQSLAAPGQASASIAVAPSTTSVFSDVTVGDLSVASGTAVLYQVRSSGVWTTVQRGDQLTSSQDRSVYGSPQTYTVRGCRDAAATVCGPAGTSNSATPVSTDVGATYTGPTDLTLTGSYAFNYDPAANPGYSKLEFRCVGGDWQDAVSGANSCTVDGGGLLAPSLDIRVTANGQTYEHTFSDPATP